MQWSRELQHEIIEEFARLQGYASFETAAEFLAQSGMREDAGSKREGMRRKRGTVFVPPNPCPVCGKAIAVRDGGTGRQKLYCGNKCRQKAWRKSNPEAFNESRRKQRWKKKQQRKGKPK